MWPSDSDLYTKITGGQRIDLFGAQVQDLPDIWEQLVDAGFESGHAYGKALRTVKSCVGTTWCRYGVQDSVGFAIRVENRYKGIRAPHKIKMAVSGCMRECAEAQSKDVGLIATEKGYNLFVCGNGGATPRHAELLASDLDEETALKYIDRFLMYYIMTADRLTRTSVWCEKLEGGLDHIRDVVVRDKLGIAAELEAMLQHLVDTYQCEWAATRARSGKAKMVPAVRQHRRDGIVHRNYFRAWTKPARRLAQRCDWRSINSACWTAAAWRRIERSNKAEALHSLGACRHRRPIFRSTAARPSNMAKRKSPCSISPAVASGMPARICARTKKRSCCRAAFWAMRLASPKSPARCTRKRFRSNSGDSLQGEEYRIRTFPVKVDGDDVYLELPPIEVLDKQLATEIGCKLATACATRMAHTRMATIWLNASVNESIDDIGNASCQSLPPGS